MFNHIEECKKALRERERCFQSIVDNIADAIVIIDKNGVICFANPAANRLFGRNLEGSVFEFPIMSNKTTEINIIPNNGSKMRYAEMRVSNIIYKGEEAYLATIRDITERKEAEEKIKRDFYTQNTLRAILRISLEPIPLKLQLERILDEIFSIPWFSLKAKGSIYLVE
ncbi:MAG: PAS domain S-box protein, partial [Nitrospirae bacterium]